MTKEMMMLTPRFEGKANTSEANVFPVYCPCCGSMAQQTQEGTTTDDVVEGVIWFCDCGWDDRWTEKDVEEWM